MAVPQGERNRRVQPTLDIPFAVPPRRLEKEPPPSNLSLLLASSGHERREEDIPATSVSILTAASRTITPSLSRMDEDSKECLLPTAGPMSSNSSQTEAIITRKLPSRSGLTSYFSSATYNNGQSTSRISVENDDTGSSSVSVSSSAATTHHSSRGPTPSHSSGNYHLEDDFSGSFNGRDTLSASNAPTSLSARKASLAKGDLTIANDGQEDANDGQEDANDGQEDANDGHAKERALSEPIDCRPRKSSPMAIPSNGSHLSNVSQLLSEWNDSPFVSSYPNQNQQSSEVSANDWSSEGLPWHIDLQKVVTGDMVATGSFGMVFKGIYKDEKVAVKVLLIPEASSKSELNKLQSNFRQEIDLWYTLSHPNVVQFIGAYIGIPKWAIVNEFLHGGSLRAYLSRQQRRRLAPATVQSMALDIARGMEYLHQNKIMHRDLKSANLLLAENGTVKVADFGLARFEAEDHGNLTAETGTIRWMAPEVICHMRYTRKIDVYSYGIVLWELCTSLIPYEGMSFVQLAHAVANDHHRPPTSDLPTSFVMLMRQCWDKDSTKRPDFSTIIKFLESGSADSSKFLPKASCKATALETDPPVDSYRRPTISMRGGNVVGRTRITGYTGPSYVANTDDALSDDEDWVTIRRQCRCTIM